MTDTLSACVERNLTLGNTITFDFSAKEKAMRNGQLSMLLILNYGNQLIIGNESTNCAFYVYRTRNASLSFWPITWPNLTDHSGFLVLILELAYDSEMHTVLSLSTTIGHSTDVLPVIARLNVLQNEYMNQCCILLSYASVSVYRLPSMAKPCSKTRW